MGKLFEIEMYCHADQNEIESKRCIHLCTHIHVAHASAVENTQLSSRTSKNVTYEMEKSRMFKTKL